MRIRVAVSGRSYDAVAKLPEHLTLPEGASVDDALGAVAGLLPEGKRLPESCLIAVSGAHLGTLGNHRGHVLGEGDELVIIAPVAGG